MKSKITVVHEISGHSEKECGDCGAWADLGRGDHWCRYFGKLKAGSDDASRNFNLAMAQECIDSAEVVSE